MQAIGVPVSACAHFRPLTPSRHAHKIAVIDKGVVVEEGSHRHHTHLEPSPVRILSRDRHVESLAGAIKLECLVFLILSNPCAVSPNTTFTSANIWVECFQTLPAYSLLALMLCTLLQHVIGERWRICLARAEGCHPRPRFHQHL